MPVNEEELKICQRRGHGNSWISEKWSQCQYCGLWLRAKKTIEEREDKPPDEETDHYTRIAKMVKKNNGTMEDQK